MTVVVRPLVALDERAFFAALARWDGGTGFLFAQGYRAELSFPEYLDLLDANARGERLLPGYVPATILSAFEAEEMVGRVSIRHELSAYLLEVGGHIGYGVLPHARGRGVARALLTAGLVVARELGIERVLLTCDEHNGASRRVIEVHGGSLENIVHGDDHPPRRRYWITLPLS